MEGAGGEGGADQAQPHAGREGPAGPTDDGGGDRRQWRRTAGAAPPGDRQGRGVSVGVDDVGIGNDVESLRQVIGEAVPRHIAMTDVGVARLTGLEVVREPLASPDGGDQVFATDLWVEVPRRPGRVAVLRL